MKRNVVWTIVAFLVVGATVLAQTQAFPGSRLGWTQAATSVTEAQGYVYRLYVDTTTVGGGTTLSPTTCTPVAGDTASFDCIANLPALVPGPHILRLTAGAGTFETAMSNGLSVIMVVIQTPTNLRIVKKFESEQELQDWLTSPEGKAIFG